MSGSTEPQAALVSLKDQGTIRAHIDIQRDAIGFDEPNEAFAWTQWRSLYRGEFNHRAADCVATKKAQTFKAAGAEV